MEPTGHYTGLGWHPKPIGTFSDDRKAYIGVDCQAGAKQFLHIRASFALGQQVLVDEEAPDDRDAEGPQRGLPGQPPIQDTW